LILELVADKVYNQSFENKYLLRHQWFHPTKVDYVRDRLTFYGFKEDKNMYIASVAGSNNNFTFPRDKISSSDAIKVTIRRLLQHQP
jgi:hypothetical protein